LRVPLDESCKPPGIDLPLSALTEMTFIPATTEASLATIAAIQYQVNDACVIHHIAQRRRRRVHLHRGTQVDK